MIKGILIIAISMILFSCSEDWKQTDTKLHFTHVVVIEGCEYFVCGASGIEILSHKGNCKNPIHKCKCIHNHP